MPEDNTQYSVKMNVCAVILNNKLIRPFFINDNLTVARYEDMFWNDHNDFIVFIKSHKYYNLIVFFQA